MTATAYANDFEGLVAIVTGAASGIGAATAELLRLRGATVAILDRVPPENDAVFRCFATS